MKAEERAKKFRKEISENYTFTFVKSLEPAIKKKFGQDIELVPSQIPGVLDKVLRNGKPVEKEVEEKIKKFIALKKKAFEKNSDYYFKERGKPNNPKENLRHRSLGEESLFNY